MLQYNLAMKMDYHPYFANNSAPKASIAKAYDRAADEYAAAFWNELDKKPFDQIILNWFAAQIPQSEIVLEIGAGPGEVSGYLARLGRKCIGTDISERMIENARKYFSQVQFEVQDFFHLNYEDDTFFGWLGSIQSST